MKSMRIVRIISAVFAALAVAVLFVTYGTVLPAAPFAPIQLDGPTVVDSDGSLSVVVDAESQRALILNADGDLTGVVGCATADTPIDAITDVCISDGLVYLSGVRFVADSDIIDQERVIVYDKGGKLQGIAYEISDINDVSPSIKALCEVKDGVVVAHKKQDSPSSEEGDSAKSGDDEGDSQFKPISLVMIEENGSHEVDVISGGNTAVHDVAFSSGETNHYVSLSIRGVLNDDASEYASHVYAGHVFTAVDISEDGTLYACDDETGALCASSPGNFEIHPFIDGKGYSGVNENNGFISLCDSVANEAKIYKASGELVRSFTEVKPSVGFSARMVIVWVSGIYLVVLVVFLAGRKARRLIAGGNTEGIGPMILAVAVVSAIAIAIGSLTFSSYQGSLQQRANMINTYADFLQSNASSLSEAMEKVDDRDALRGDENQLSEALNKLSEAAKPALLLVSASNQNDIGVYCTIYGRDAKGIFYLYGSSLEHVMGTSAHVSGSEGLEDAFLVDSEQTGQLLQGRALRDAAQYRFVQIPSSDGKSVAGVIEVGSKTRSFEASVLDDLAHRIIGLLVMVLVVYLAYCELRACGRSLFSYRQRRIEDSDGAVVALTRPFALAITMLASFDSIMTVLIARDLLDSIGASDSSPLLALPAAMLGAGLVIGLALYGFMGSRVGLRRLMVGAAITMLACASFTTAAVFSGNFWLYCVAKLALAVPFGILHAMSYSMPRLAADDDERASAMGDVIRTDTSAAALGTVLGGYAAQMLGNLWVYALVAIACVPVVIMALNLLPRGIRPLEVLAQRDESDGRVRAFMRSPAALALAVFVVLPVTIAAGYASFLFPLFSADLGLAKSNINNIVVMGQLVVYVCIGSIDRAQERFGEWNVTVVSVLLLGCVFLLFAINATLAWSIAVIVIVALLCKSSDNWQVLWMRASDAVGVPAGGATSAMLATQSLALVAQPFLLGALLGAANSVSVIVIGALCTMCAALFFLCTRNRNYC